MASYDSKIINVKGLAQLLSIVKTTIDVVNDKTDDNIPKVKNATLSNLPVLTTEGTLTDSGIKIADIQTSIPSAIEGNLISSDATGAMKDSGYKPADFQLTDALLTSLSSVTETSGILTLQGTDTVSVRKIMDTDITTGESLANAVTAFNNKDGSIIISNDKAIISNGKELLKHNGAATIVGSETEAVLFKTTIVDGKPQLYTGSVDPLSRIINRGELEAYVTASSPKSSDYIGIGTYFASGANMDEAVSKITIIDPSDFPTGNTTPSGYGYDVTANILYRGTYNTATRWTWIAQPAISDGDWLYFNHIIDDAYSLENAGKVVFTNEGNSKHFEVMVDNTLVPDGVYVTIDADKKLTLKTETIKSGAVTVPVGFNAASIKVDSDNTIQDILNKKMNNTDIVIADPSSTSTDLEVVSAKNMFTILGEKNNLTTTNKTNHVAAINELDSELKSNKNLTAHLRDTKLDKLTGVTVDTVGNIITIKDVAGNVVDSGIKLADLTAGTGNGIAKITTPTTGAVPTINATGELDNSNTTLADIDKVIVEAIRAEDIITDEEIMLLINDAFGTTI